MFYFVPEVWPLQQPHLCGRQRHFRNRPCSRGAEHIGAFLQPLFLRAAGQGDGTGCCGERWGSGTSPFADNCQCDCRQQHCQSSQKMNGRQRHRQTNLKKTKDGKETVTNISLGSLDFQGFHPKEIQLKVTSDGIVVHGRHGDQYNSVEITKKVPLPPDTDYSRIQCHYVDGVVNLDLTAPEKTCLEESMDMGKDDLEKKEDTKNDRADDTREEEDWTNIKEAVDESVDNLPGLISVIFGIPPPKTQRKGKRESDDDQERRRETTETKEENEEQSTVSSKTETEKSSCKSEAVEDKDCSATHVADDVGDFAVDETSPMRKFDDIPGEQTLSVEKQTTHDVTEKVPLDHVISGEIKENDTTDQTTHGVFTEQTTQDVFTEQTTQNISAEQTALCHTSEDAEVESLMSETIPDEETVDKEKIQGSFTSSGYIIVTDVTEDAADFKAQLDLSHFNPGDIKVVFKDGNIIVEAERETKGDNYSQTEYLNRRISVPEAVDGSKLRSFLSDNGIMTIQTTPTGREIKGDEKCYLELIR